MFKNLKFSALRTAFLALLPFLLHLKVTFAAGAPSVSWPPLSTVFPDLPHLAATVLAWYELLIRFVPSAQNNSILSMLYQILNGLIPNAAIAEDGSLGTHEYEQVIDSVPAGGGGQPFSAAGGTSLALA